MRHLCRCVFHFAGRPGQALSDARAYIAALRRDGAFSRQTPNTTTSGSLPSRDTFRGRDADFLNGRETYRSQQSRAHGDRGVTFENAQPLAAAESEPVTPPASLKGRPETFANTHTAGTGMFSPGVDGGHGLGVMIRGSGRHGAGAETTPSNAPPTACPVTPATKRRSRWADTPGKVRTNRSGDIELPETLEACHELIRMMYSTLRRADAVEEDHLDQIKTLQDRNTKLLADLRACAAEMSALQSQVANSPRGFSSRPYSSSGESLVGGRGSGGGGGGGGGEANAATGSDVRKLQARVRDLEAVLSASGIQSNGEPRTIASAGTVTTLESRPVSLPPAPDADARPTDSIESVRSELRQCRIALRQAREEVTVCKAKLKERDSEALALERQRRRDLEDVQYRGKTDVMGGEQKLGETRWETESLLQVHEALMQEFSAYRKRAADVMDNAPKYKELTEEATAAQAGMDKVEQLAKDRKAALDARMEEHHAFEQRQLAVAAKTEGIASALDDISESLEAPVSVHSKHEVAIVQQSMADLEASLNAQKTSLDEVVEENAALGDKPNPYERLVVSDVQAQYASVEEALAVKKAEFDENMAKRTKIHDLQKEFGAAANEFDSWLSAGVKELETITGQGELEDQLSALHEKKGSFTTEAESKSDALKEVKTRLREAGEVVGETNSHTAFTLPGLMAKKDSALAAFDDQIDVVESRIVAKKGMDITPEQMEELKQSFKAFDREGNGKLSQADFRQCLESLGQELSDEEQETTFKEADQDGSGFITFEEFVAHMQTIMRVTDSYDDILGALQAVNGDTISEDGLSAMLSPEVASYVLGVAPKADDGNIDVKALLAMVFDVTNKA